MRSRAVLAFFGFTLHGHPASSVSERNVCEHQSRQDIVFLIVNICHQGAQVDAYSILAAAGLPCWVSLPPCPVWQADWLPDICGMFPTLLSLFGQKQSLCWSHTCWSLLKYPLAWQVPENWQCTVLNRTHRSQACKKNTLGIALKSYNKFGRSCT